MRNRDIHGSAYPYVSLFVAADADPILGCSNPCVALIYDTGGVSSFCQRSTRKRDQKRSHLHDLIESLQ